MEWQPISTAPKGVSVLLYVLAQTPCYYVGRERFGNLGEPQMAEFEWRCDSSGRFARPTHWQPLPLPPKETA